MHRGHETAFWRCGDRRGGRPLEAPDGRIG
nr:MAG TPA: hypothetical protein [Caudoviricetes sp.]